MPFFDYGAISVGSNAVQPFATPPDPLPTEGVQLIADPGNVDVIYIGDAGVTTANGLPLSQGKGIWIPTGGTRKLEDIHAISDTAAQSLRWMSF